MTTTETAAAATPTDRWLAMAGDLPPLSGAAGVAERLLLLLHYGVDWDGWISGKLTDYWDRILPERILQASIRAANLRRFWQDVSQQLQSRPRNAAERLEVERLLRAEPRPVLEAMRWEVEPLLLRVRIVSEAVRAAKPSKRDDAQ